jgi:murein L,D-transpeptidase YcbB/YkuD
MSEEGFHDERSKALLRAVLDAHTDALRLDAYAMDELVRGVSALRQSQKPTADQIAEADVLLTAAYAALGEDLLTGQVNPKKVAGQSWFIDAQEEAVDSALVRALLGSPLDKSIATMRPQDEDYAALRKELLRYRDLAAKGGWPAVPAGRALKPGESDAAARLAALRARLAAEGVLADSGAVPAADSAVRTPEAARPAQTSPRARAAQSAAGSYDRALAGAVARYQALHNIPVDSVLGEETVKSLNVPAQQRMLQIAANLERFRWLPRQLGARYVLVNVPAFRLEGFDNGQKAIEMKVIVGQEFEGRSTPVFSDSMETVVFRPYWLVTPDIQAKELEPKIAADPGYLSRGNYEYYSEGGKQRIRQKPGEKNSLGLVKFLFPNDFNIYLHDTPQDDLFEKDVRAFSHGCIRLEKPAEFAQWVLGWDAARVQQAMQSGPNDTGVRLPRKLPVYIAYFTSYLRDGRLHWGNDVYDRDGTLAQAVAPGAVPSAEAVRTIDALRKLVDD